MTSTEARSSFLRVPPFPGARVRSITSASQPLPLADAEFDQAVELIVSMRVGGGYWGRQPPLPSEPYVLVRVTDPQSRTSVKRSVAPDCRLLWWIDDCSAFNEANTVVGACDPWHVIAGASQVITDDDELAMITALAGIPVSSPGSRLDRTSLLQQVKRSLSKAFKDPFTGQPLAVIDAIKLCGFWRALIDSNRPLQAAVGFAAWKQTTAEPLLWSGRSVLFAPRARDLKPGDEVAAWKSRVAPARLAKLKAAAVRLIEVEDGFIRSVGLGANCVPPLSLVVDRRGAYFDPQQASELEDIIEGGNFSADLIERARRLRQLIVESGISKYAVGRHSRGRAVDMQQRVILVAGQVEDDRSVRCGGGAIQTNLALLEQVRQTAPDAFVIYKPHPDVAAGHRVGAVAKADLAGLVDEIAGDDPISTLIELVDEVHVNTSLAGFEALLRGTSVTTYGTPFYAGWGLTNDRGAVPARRTARRSVDELVAAVLLLYPRYLDPVSGLPCPAEILVRRLSLGEGARPGALVTLRRAQGYLRRCFASWRSR